LQLRHIGSVGYLTHQQRQAVIDWLKHKNYWNLQELETHIEEHYQVVFESNQSYYELFAQARISWKKTQRSNPKKDPELVKKTGHHGVVGISPT
jgi:putative transposase